MWNSKFCLALTHKHTHTPTHTKMGQSQQIVPSSDKWRGIFDFFCPAVSGGDPQKPQPRAGFPQWHPPPRLSSTHTHFNLWPPTQTHQPAPITKLMPCPQSAGNGCDTGCLSSCPPTYHTHAKHFFYFISFFLQTCCYSGNKTGSHSWSLHQDPQDSFVNEIF